ncbi:hypothetical protein TNCV_2766191 [Trichonephila clavipes]|nr:hypothetical protein TNCV_2766191 [Trichonephila clavipes]
MRAEQGTLRLECDLFSRLWLVFSLGTLFHRGSRYDMNQVGRVVKVYHFEYEAVVPQSVESLFDIKEDAAGGFLFIKSLNDFICGSEKLMTR